MKKTVWSISSGALYTDGSDSCLIFERKQDAVGYLKDNGCSYSKEDDLYLLRKDEVEMRWYRIDEYHFVSKGNKPDEFKGCYFGTGILWDIPNII